MKAQHSLKAREPISGFILVPFRVYPAYILYILYGQIYILHQMFAGMFKVPVHSPVHLLSWKKEGVGVLTRKFAGRG